MPVGQDPMAGTDQPPYSRFRHASPPFGSVTENRQLMITLTPVPRADRDGPVFPPAAEDWSLPLALLSSLPPAAALRRAVPPEPTVIPGRILVVDDDAGIRKILTAMLQKYGYLTQDAADGEEGWDTLRAGSFDVLITDQEMPRLTGLDLLRRARAQLFHLPVILISGNLPYDEPGFRHLLLPGCALAKPFTFVELLAAVRGCLVSGPDPAER